MNEFRPTAQAHMDRDLATGPKWVCACEACQAIRSLVGMEKALSVRPLVRQIEEVEERLGQEPDATRKRILLDHYFDLYDQLADEMSK